MVGIRRGITWWRAIWPSALGVAMFFGLCIAVALPLGAMPFGTDLASVLLTWAEFSIPLTVAVVYIVRIAFGPARIVAFARPPLSDEEQRAFKRRERRWYTFTLCSFPLFAVSLLSLLSSALFATMHALSSERLVLRIVALLLLLGFVLLLVGIAGEARVRRIRKEGPPLIGARDWHE